MGLRSTFGTDLRGVHVFTDFDGTLSHVVDIPDDATAAVGVADALKGITNDGGSVTVVSGRPVSFLTSRLPGIDAELVGLYGLERSNAGSVDRHPDGESWIPVVAATKREAETALSGLIVESKELSLTVHFRDEPHREAEVREWAEQMGRTSGLEVRAARKSVELHPPVNVDKGSAVRDRVTVATRAVVMIGDDVGDLPAFAALDDLASETSTLRIVVSSSELDDRLASLADITLQSPDEVVAFLRG